MKESQAILAFGALAQQTRLQIIIYLVACGEGGAIAGEIGDEVKASSSRLSFHLAALEHANLIISERQSRTIRYRASFENLGGLAGYLLHDCCNSDPTVSGYCEAAKCC